MDMTSYLNGVVDSLTGRANFLEGQITTVEKLSGLKIEEIISKLAAGYTLTPPPEVEVWVNDN